MKLLESEIESNFRRRNRLQTYWTTFTIFKNMSYHL